MIDLNKRIMIDILDKDGRKRTCEVRSWNISAVNKKLVCVWTNDKDGWDYLYVNKNWLKETDTMDKYGWKVYNEVLP